MPLAVSGKAYYRLVIGRNYNLPVASEQVMMAFGNQDLNFPTIDSEMIIWPELVNLANTQNRHSVVREANSLLLPGGTPALGRGSCWHPLRVEGKSVLREYL